MLSRIFKAKSTGAKGWGLKTTNYVYKTQMTENFNIIIPCPLVHRLPIQSQLFPNGGKKRRKTCFDQICIHVTFSSGSLPISSISIFHHIYSWCLNSINLCDAQGFLNFISNKHILSINQWKSDKKWTSEGTTLYPKASKWNITSILSSCYCHQQYQQQ